MESDGRIKKIANVKISEPVSGLFDVVVYAETENLGLGSIENALNQRDCQVRDFSGFGTSIRIGNLVLDWLLGDFFNIFCERG